MRMWEDKVVFMQIFQSLSLENVAMFEEDFERILRGEFRHVFSQHKL